MSEQNLDNAGSIQIVGGREKNWKKFFDHNIRATSVADVLANYQEYVDRFPEEERYNLFFTVANCHEGYRQFAFQEVVHFDIDNIDTERIEEYIIALCQTLGLERDETGIVFSGHGLHFYVKLEQPLYDEHFSMWKQAYNKTCEILTKEINSRGLPGKCDPVVWDLARLMRLPGSENRKEKRAPVSCYPIQTNLSPQRIDLPEFTGTKPVETPKYNENALVAHPRPVDPKAVMAGCSFLQHCKSGAKLSEPQWYAALSLVSRFPDGRRSAHEISKLDPRYDARETDAKIDHALKDSGPYTCNYVSGLWDKCQNCDHFKKFQGKSSAVTIKPAEFIATEATGFHRVLKNRKGEVSKLAPSYEDLVKKFKQDFHYASIQGASGISVYGGTHWQEYPDDNLRKYAQDNFRPNDDILIKHRNEFVARIRIDNMRSPNWVAESCEGTINLPNGIFKTDTMKLVPHSPEYGHTYVLDYSYDPHAKCPNFDKFLDEITCGRRDLGQIILEFIAFGLSSHKCDPAKALILYGEGANGKSTLLNLIRKIVGQTNCSAVDMGSLKNDVSRTLLVNKLFNIAEETPYAGLKDTSHIFKDLITGGVMITKTHYKMPVQVNNNAKFIFACNELPKSNDVTKGLVRRFMIVPFDRNFADGEQIRDMDSRLEAELPGILNRVIEAYHSFKKRGDFPESASSKRELLRFQEDNDCILAWKNECIEVKDLDTQADIFVPTTDLWESFLAYMEYTKTQKYNLNWQTFVQRLSKIMPKLHSGKVYIRGVQVRGYHAIKCYTLDDPKRKGAHALSVIKGDKNHE